MGLYQPSPPQPVLLQALILAFLISTERDQNLETCSFCSERSRKWSRVSRQRGFQSSQAWPCLEWAQVFLICSHFLAIAGWLLSWPKEGGGGVLPIGCEQQHLKTTWIWQFQILTESHTNDYWNSLIHIIAISLGTIMNMLWACPASHRWSWLRWTQTCHWKNYNHSSSTSSSESKWE